MAKVTTSRHLLLTLAVVLIAATGLMFWGFMSNPAYADDRGDVREIELNNAEDSDLWSDDTLIYNVVIPADVDYDSIKWIVGVRGEDDWEIELGDRDNEEKYYEYDGMGELLLHGDKIFDEIGEEHLDIYVNVKNGGNVVAEGFAGVDVRESRYEYDLPQDDNILPEWDGWVDRSLRVWVENKENPDGNEYERSIIEIKAVSENPGKILKMREDFYGWSYDGIDCGTVRFCVTYIDLGDEVQTCYFNVNVSETVYDANLWAPEGVYQGLPGTEIDLEASAVKHTATRQGDGWRHDSTSDGLNLSWSFEDPDSTRFAEMEVSDDPAKATVFFKDIDEEWIDERIGVRVGVTDEESTPSIERVSNRTDLFMRSEYYQIWPATIDSSLDVGKVTTIEPEVRFYRYGQSGHSAVEDPRFTVEDFDPEAVEIDYEVGDEFIYILRKADRDTNFNIRADFDTDDGNESIDQWYHLDRKNYDAWFKYDHKDIYSDQNPVHIEIETEDLDGIVDDINDPTNDDYELSYTIGVWDDNQEEFVYTMPIQCYVGDFDGLHFDGDDFRAAVVGARDALSDKDIDGLNARVQLKVAGNVIQDNWTWLNLRETCMENGHEDHSWIKQTIREKTCIDPGRQVWICLDDPVWGGCGEVRWFDYAGDSDELGPCALIKIPAKAPTLTAPGNIEHYKCKVCEKLYSDANGQKEITPESVVIDKKPNPLTIKAKTATVKYSKLKKKNQTLAVTKVIAFTQKGQGAMTYSKVSGSKKITINKTSGKVTVKKGLKKGTYKIKVKAKAAGNADYIASDWKTVTFKIKVK